MRNKPHKKRWIYALVLLLIGVHIVQGINATDSTEQNQIGNIQCVDVDVGLVGYWSFDELDGSMVPDESGQNNHGTNQGTTVVDGFSGNACDFDGVDDWIAIPDDESLELSEDFTVLCWLYQRSHPEGSMFMSKHEPEVNHDYSWWVRSAINSSYPNTLAFHSFPGPYAQGEGTFPLDTWTQVVVTFIDATNDFCFYINAELDTQVTADVDIRDNDKTLSIGSENGEKYFFDGIIDEVRIYERALSEEEIQGLYDNPAGLQTTFIVGRLTNLNQEVGNLITFDAVNLRGVQFLPFEYIHHQAGEHIKIAEHYKGILTSKFIFAICDANI
jgi:hypothetical protein